MSDLYDAYCIGYNDGLKNCYCADRKNPYNDNTEQADMWISDYDRGFEDSSTDEEGDVE